MASTALSGLILTKLAPPRLGSVRVGRDALLQRLDARRDRILTTIVGPAGSGKTTLAAMWRQRLIAAGHDVAWYNVGADDDEMRWAVYLFASLQHGGVEVGAALAHALQNEATYSASRF